MPSLITQLADLALARRGIARHFGKGEIAYKICDYINNRWRVTARRHVTDVSKMILEDGGDLYEAIVIPRETIRSVDGFSLFTVVDEDGYKEAWIVRDNAEDNSLMAEEG